MLDYLNDSATFWLRQAIRDAHMLNGLMERGAVPEMPRYPEMTPYMLRRLADQIEALPTQSRRAA